MNRKIVITGASGEIGGAIASKFAAEGDTLLLVGYRNSDALEALCDNLSQDGASCISVTADLSTLEGVESVVTAVDRFLGGVDVLINNAGLSHVELFQDSTDENLAEIVNTNLLSAVRLTKSLVPAMVSKKSGRILNITSVWGEVGASMEVEYSMTKGGLIAFTKALAKELAPSGIAVNAISPGAIDTKMNACHSAEELAALAEEIPVGRMGTPEEVAELTYLISNAPLYLTAQNIRIDGGWV